MTTIAHHPTELTLGSYAAGTLDEGRRLVVATHVSLCGQCRNDIRALEHVGGSLLDDLPPTPLPADALARTLERVEGTHAASLPTQSSLIEFPAPLARYAIGPWRWVGPGVHWRSVSVPVADETRVFMLRAEPGTRLPHHRHAGIEWTCVLEGAFRHDLGRFGAGDFDEADETMEHKPVIEQGVACVCLVALQRTIELQGWLGRLLQPLIRI